MLLENGNCLKIVVFIQGFLLMPFFVKSQEEIFISNEINELNDKILGTDGYCEPELCKTWNGTDFNYLNHIGCNNTQNFTETCPSDAGMMDMNQRRINLLLDLHNAARNRIAMGMVSGYKSAVQMPALKWDNELAYLASLNVKRCKFAHDQCRNTLKYQYSGQNIGISWQKPKFHSNSKRMKLIVGLWFNEYKDANQSFIDSYENHPEGKKIGHFTLIVSDRVKRVGCAATRFTHEVRGKAFLIACNYDFNSIFGEPIYRTGQPASNCFDDLYGRKSGRFPGLCDWENDYEDSEESKEIENNLLQIPELL